MSDRWILRRLEGHVTVVELVPKKIVGEEAIERIGESLFRLPNVEKIKDLILDFSRQEYVVSAFLREVLLPLRRTVVRELNGKLVVCEVSNEGLDDGIDGVFRVSRLNLLLDGYFVKTGHSLQEALKRFAE